MAVHTASRQSYMPQFRSMVDRIWFVAIHLVMAAVLFTAGTAHATSRIKDLAGFEGVRDNVLVGYGLVVGLQGTGDDLKCTWHISKFMFSVVPAAKALPAARTAAATVIPSNVFIWLSLCRHVLPDSNGSLLRMFLN